MRIIYSPLKCIWNFYSFKIRNGCRDKALLNLIIVVYVRSRTAVLEMTITVNTALNAKKNFEKGRQNINACIISILKSLLYHLLHNFTRWSLAKDVDVKRIIRGSLIHLLHSFERNHFRNGFKWLVFMHEVDFNMVHLWFVSFNSLFRCLLVWMQQLISHSSASKDKHK